MRVAFLMMVLSIWSVFSFSHATISPVSSIVPLLFAVSLVSPAIIPHISALPANLAGEAAQRHFAILVQGLNLKVFLFVDELFKLVKLADADIELYSFLVPGLSVDGDVLEDFAEFGRLVLMDWVGLVCDISLAVCKH
jgi:hypothetical protein